MVESHTSHPSNETHPPWRQLCRINTAIAPLLVPGAALLASAAIDSFHHYDNVGARQCAASNTLLHRCDKDICANGQLDGSNTTVPWSPLLLLEHSRRHERKAAGTEECDSVESLSRAIELGSRSWNTSVGSAISQQPLLAEALPSHFQPLGCHLGIGSISSSRACRALSRFENVILFGDSLSRHLHQAVTMLLTNDYVYGGLALERTHGIAYRAATPGIAPKTKTTVNLDDARRCACDSQFSGAEACRTLQFGYLSPITTKTPLTAHGSLYDALTSGRASFLRDHIYNDTISADALLRCTGASGLRVFYHGEVTGLLHADAMQAVTQAEASLNHTSTHGAPMTSSPKSNRGTAPVNDAKLLRIDARTRQLYHAFWAQLLCGRGGRDAPTRPNLIWLQGGRSLGSSHLATFLSCTVLISPLWRATCLRRVCGYMYRRSALWN